MNQRKKSRRVCIHLIFVLLISVILFLTYKVSGVLREQHKAAKEYEEIREKVLDETIEEGETSVQVDFKLLMDINPDVVAWIRFDKLPVIDYPIVQAEDNEKYLTTTFAGENNGAGCLFMDCNNAVDFSDENTFIYGHHKENGHMFGSLSKFQDKDYYNGHSTFTIYTPDGTVEEYQIFAVTIVEADSEHYRKVYVNEEEYGDYLAMIRKSALYETDVEVSVESKILSLSTCTNVRAKERLMLHAVRTKQSINKEEVKK